MYKIIYLIAVVAVVAMWRGLWGLMDLYLWPKNPKIGYWVSFLVGFIIIAFVIVKVAPR